MLLMHIYSFYSKIEYDSFLKIKLFTSYCDTFLFVSPQSLKPREQKKRNGKQQNLTNTSFPTNNGI